MNDYEGIGRVEQFDRRHGSDSIPLDGWRLYSNGAMRENSSYGVMMPPPVKLHECCKLKVLYRETVFQKAAEDFRVAKHRLSRIIDLNRENDYGPPDERELKKVKDLQINAKACKVALAKVRRELELSLPVEQRRSKKQQAEDEEAIAKFSNTLNDLKI